MIFNIPKNLYNQYKGAGYALAAITGEQIIKVIYFEDMSPILADALADDDEGQHGDFFVRQFLKTQGAAPFIRELQAMGEVSVGMCSCYTFVEL